MSASNAIWEGRLAFQIRASASPISMPGQVLEDVFSVYVFENHPQAQD